MNIFEYFKTLLDTFGYFWILYGYFKIPQDTLRYFKDTLI